ncbi:MAG: sulfatase-like hydrolase/transferase [Candidatus Brocadia sp.]|nr:sulfatase-like hydrolase/transferase [Candidatus Brocadia sp.]
MRGKKAAGWSVAFDAPFGWMKQVASDFGGTRNGIVVHWPKGIKAKNEIRTQFSHVVDVAPTILEAAGLPEPKEVNGTLQIPMEGVSMVYTFGNDNARDRHITQYFEIADVGIDLGTPVVEAIGSEARSRFAGHIRKVTVDVYGESVRADAQVREAQKEVERTTG